MKKLLLLLSVGFCFNGMSQLSGNAFLAGQTNHSGIKVKFNAHAGTAISDSTNTTSTGSYSINITGGVYDVVFSKSGYLNSNYSNSATVVLTNSVVLNNDTLQPGNQVFVSGNVSGNWTSNNTYIVNGDITIVFGQTLTIQPGTSIRFNGNYSVIANGVLLAQGNSANPILFTSNISTPAISDWNSIQINNSSCIIDNCIIEYPEFGITSNNNSPVISNNIIRNTIEGIYCAYGSPHIFNNEVYNCINSGNSAIGIWSTGSNAVVECNHVHNCTSMGWNGYGIVTYANLVRNNIVHDITGGVATGIQTRGSNSQIENNYVYNCGTGISLSNSTVSPFPSIYNNTINNCSNTGILIDDNSGSAYNPSIINNLITNCYYGMSQGGSGPTQYPVFNNLLFNNSTANYNNVQVTGIGQIVSTNAQGNAIDSYYNMSQNPLFSGALPPALSSSSPCLNAGDTSYSRNIGFDTMYSCSSSITTIKAFNKQWSGLVNIYPNPAQTNFTIEVSYNKKQLLNIYDVNGKLVMTQTINGNATIDASKLVEGIYNLIIISNEGIVNKRLVIVR